MNTATVPEIKPRYAQLVHCNTPEEVSQIQQSINENERQLFGGEEAEDARHAQIKPYPVPRDETDWLAKAIWNALRAVPRSA